MCLFFTVLLTTIMSVLCAPDSITNPSNDNLPIEHSVTAENARNAIEHLVPDLSKNNNNLLLVDKVIN